MVLVMHKGLVAESQGQILAWTVLCAPYSLERGTQNPEPQILDGVFLVAEAPLLSECGSNIGHNGKFRYLLLNHSMGEANDAFMFGSKEPNKIFNSADVGNE